MGQSNSFLGKYIKSYRDIKKKPNKLLEKEEQRLIINFLAVI